MNEQDLTKKIGDLEQEIIKKKQELYQLKRSVKRYEIPDYTLVQRDGRQISLSELFGNKSEMILVHNMGKACPYCTLWADGLNGLYKHLENRAAFVVSTPDSPKEMNDFAVSRGWNFSIVSTHICSLKRDLGFQLEDDSYYPGVSTLLKDESGKIFHIAKAYFGPGDDFCALWYLFDLLPNEDPEWAPKFSY